MKVRPTSWAVLLLSLSIAVSGCKKPEDGLGVDLLPDGQGLGVVLVDTTTVIAYTKQEDPVRTSGLSRNLVGSYLDSDFGLVKASAVTQVRLSTSNVGAGQDNSELVADSIVLALVYDPLRFSYGNLNTQSFKVYEISDTLSTDSIYRNDDIPNLIGDDLVAYKKNDIKPTPLQNAIVGPDTLLPQLRIPLDRAFGQRLLDQWGQTPLVSNTEFLEYLRGIYITTDNGPQFPFQEGILYFSLLNANSKMTLYYRNELPGAVDTLQFDFLINDNSVRYTVCEHGLDQAVSPDLALGLQDSTLGQSKLFVQACGGYRSLIRFPTLLQLADSGLNALAKAELVIPVAGTYYPFHLPPSQLFAFRKNDENADVLLPDQLESYGFSNGTYDQDAREYRFIITRYVQGLLIGKYNDNGLQIVTGSSGVSVARALLNGPEATGEKMKLILTFTSY